MFKFIGGNLKEFWKGFGGFGFAGGTLIFTTNIFILDLAGKILIACMVAAVGGFTTALVSDIYKHHIQKKFFKKQEDGKRTEKDEKAA